MCTVKYACEAENAGYINVIYRLNTDYVPGQLRSKVPVELLVVTNNLIPN